MKISGSHVHPGHPRRTVHPTWHHHARLLRVRLCRQVLLCGDDRSGDHRPDQWARPSPGAALSHWSALRDQSQRWRKSTGLPTVCEVSARGQPHSFLLHAFNTAQGWSTYCLFIISIPQFRFANPRWRALPPPLHPLLQMICKRRKSNNNIKSHPNTNTTNRCPPCTKQAVKMEERQKAVEGEKPLPKQQKAIVAKRNSRKRMRQY